jgi:signal transduction histidine kinase
MTHDLSRSVPLWLVGLSLTIPPLAYLYATARHHLFGIDRLLNRTLVYAILSLGIFALYLGPLLLLYHLLPGDWLIQATVVSGLTLLVGLSFDRLRKQVQRWVDILFYGGWYDYPGVVETVSETLARSLEWEQLTEVLTRQVPDLMQLYPGHLSIREPHSSSPPRLPASGLQLPLTFEGQALGSWTVAPRRDGEDFSASDQRILHTLARQAEIALSNVLLVERLRRQLGEIRATQRQLLRSREEERARLARELHDGPMQELVGLNLQMGLLLAVGEDGAGSKEALQDMRAEVRGLLVELRGVCGELRPPMLDTLGLGGALRALADEWSAQHGVAVRLDLAPDDTLRIEERSEPMERPGRAPHPEVPPDPVEAARPLSGEVAVNLYRVVQETLANVARHAHARLVTIRLAWEDSRLVLTAQDDGEGFAMPSTFDELVEHGHFGLVGMQERVNLIGGTWTVESAPGQGTTVRVEWDMT